MSDNDRPRRTNADDRDYPEWFKSIGPEDEDPEVIAQNIEDGFSLYSEDDYESSPTMPSDMPTWSEEAVYGEDMTFLPDNDERMITRLDDDEGFQIIDEDEL
jgi:hypothetical protein